MLEVQLWAYRSNASNDKVDILDCFSKECAKANVPDLLYAYYEFVLVVASMQNCYSSSDGRINWEKRDRANKCTSEFYKVLYAH